VCYATYMVTTLASTRKNLIKRIEELRIPIPPSHRSILETLVNATVRRCEPEFTHVGRMYDGRIAGSVDGGENWYAVTTETGRFIHINDIKRLIESHTFSLFSLDERQDLYNLLGSMRAL